MAGFSVGGSLPLEHFVSQESSAMRTRLEEYGVFELWFEEIRFEPKDYIYILDSGNIYQIENCKEIGEVLHWNTVGVDKGWAYRFCSPLNNIRHATAEEIEGCKKQLPSINGFEGIQEGEYIVYGCQKIHIEAFKRMYEACMYVNVTSITIAGQQIKIETLQEIYEKTY